MEASLKLFYILGLLAILSIAGLEQASGAGPCGKSSADEEAMKLVPCAEAAQDEKAAVSQSCCSQVKILGKNPSCLCAVMLSDTAKSSGVNPQVAMGIPKRCNLAGRPDSLLTCGCRNLECSCKIFVQLKLTVL